MGTFLFLSAAGICLITAITTSLRALGHSQAYHGIRRGEFFRVFRVHILVTVVWIIAAGGLLLPVVNRQVGSEQYGTVFVLAVLYFCLVFAAAIIWKRAFSSVR